MPILEQELVKGGGVGVGSRVGGSFVARVMLVMASFIYRLFI